MDIFLRWQKQDPSGRHSWAALVIGALLFPTGIPALLALGGPALDRTLGIGSFSLGWVSAAAGSLAVLAGGAIAIWTIVLQITRASGTPFPMLPTQRLLTGGPFQLCRNPMTLGTLLAYTGVAILAGSFSALAFVSLFGAALVAYLKLIEEKELPLRFGQEYLEYKRRTPFLIPGLRRRGSPER